MRDDDIIRRAELWATGATIHDVKGLIGLYRSGTYILDHPENHGDFDYHVKVFRAHYFLDAARRRLEAFMAHGDYRKACRDNPFEIF